MPAKKTAKKATAKKAAKKVAAKKTTPSETKPAAKKAAPKKSTASVKTPLVPSTEAIARQAYLNYLHRIQNGLPGDAQGDWVAAEKQLSQA